MTNATLILAPQTEKTVLNFLQNPGHGLLLAGPQGVGKKSLAVQLVAELLGINQEQVHKRARVKFLEGEGTGIEQVRELAHFFSLKVPEHGNLINRVAVITNAHTLSQEAQNALLKMLEEPPEGSLLVLTAADRTALLPTVLSRLQLIGVTNPESSRLAAHFKDQGIEETKISQALALSGGLPGLTYALIYDESHALRAAAAMARSLISQSTYDRLGQVEPLSKDRSLALNTAYVLQQMARISLRKATNQQTKRWQKVLVAAYEAQDALTSNAQPKLTLTKLMLEL